MSQTANYSQIKIIYEDPDFLIIDKPSGLLTHPANRQDKSESVVGWLLEKYPEIAKVRDQYGTSVGSSSTSLEESKLVLDKWTPNETARAHSGPLSRTGWTDLRPGIVHRLDRETSGLLLIAKNQSSFDYLKKLFVEREIKKTYLALVYGHLKNKSGVIETPIGKLPGRTGGTRQTTKTLGKHNLKEKSAVTNYKVLQEFKYLELPETAYSLLETSPKTGRTHQIRVHLKSIGHPVVCDPFYAGKKNTCPAELGRLFLHAQKLSFVSPSGTIIAVESDLPSSLQDFLSSLIGISKH